VPTINFRVSDDDLAEIDRCVELHGFPSRTAFLLELALASELSQTADERRFEDIEKRLALLEEAWLRNPL
jgi:uncharacterized protein (DUF1778 family)